MSYRFLLILFFIFVTQVSYAHNESLESVTILVNESGFTPREVVVTPHTTIIFTNTGLDNHWPASDAHPTHTHYSGTNLGTHCASDYAGDEPFDSCGGIVPNESWSFTFETVGTFNYHDHLWSHLDGVVIVKERPQTVERKNNFEILWDKIKNFFASLFSNSDDDISPDQTNELQIETPSAADSFNKIKSELVTITLEQNPTIAINELASRSDEDSGVAALCHDLLHEIGRTAFYKYGDFSTAVTYQNDFCNSGYIHGLFEGLFVSEQIDPQDITELCNEYASAGRPFDIWQCYHGIGHGFMYLTGGDLDESLSNCGKYLGGPAVSQCYNGVYMEVFNNEVLDKEPNFVDKNNPFNTCSEAGRGKNDCYLYAPTYFTQNLGLSYSEALEACKEVAAIHRNSCINGVATEAAKRNQNDLEQVFAMCDTLNRSSEEKACVTGASVISVFQTASIDEALNKCSSAPPKYKEDCVSAVTLMEPMFE